MAELVINVALFFILNPIAYVLLAYIFFFFFPQNDTRSIVHLNTFGFNANGSLDVKLLSLSIPDNVDYPVSTQCLTISECIQNIGSFERVIL